MFLFCFIRVLFFYFSVYFFQKYSFYFCLQLRAPDNCNKWILNISTIEIIFHFIIRPDNVQVFKLGTYFTNIWKMRSLFRNRINRCKCLQIQLNTYRWIFFFFWGRYDWYNIFILKMYRHCEILIASQGTISKENYLWFSWRSLKGKPRLIYNNLQHIERLLERKKFSLIQMKMWDEWWLVWFYGESTIVGY